MTTHGHTRHRGVTPIYRAWVNMHTRCTNPKATRYSDYGGRGITVCKRWASFEAFLADVGNPPTTEHSIDRIDTNGNYEPGNVRWVTHTEQCRNRRSNRAVIRDDGARFATLAEAAQSVGGKIGGVWSVCNGEQDKHRGYGWRYAHDPLSFHD